MLSSTDLDTFQVVMDYFIKGDAKILLYFQTFIFHSWLTQLNPTKVLH